VHQDELRGSRAVLGQGTVLEAIGNVTHSCLELEVPVVSSTSTGQTFVKRLSYDSNSDLHPNILLSNLSILNKSMSF
jgi:hypothetical protein